MREGALLVVHTTVSPATARDLAEAGAGRAVAVVDAPVSGSAQDIADGRVTVMLVGAERDVERARAVVSAYGEPVLAVGPLGSAQRSEEHTSELPSLMRISYAVFCLKKKNNNREADTISTGAH